MTNNGAQRIVVIDSQKLNMMQLCARKFKFSFTENIEPIIKEVYFERGSLLHDMLKIYYNSRKYGTRWVVNNRTHADIVAACVKAGRQLAARMQLQLEDVEDVIDTFQQYTE